MFAHPTCSLKIPSASSHGYRARFEYYGLRCILERLTLSALKGKAVVVKKGTQQATAKIFMSTVWHFPKVVSFATVLCSAVFQMVTVNGLNLNMLSHTELRLYHHFFTSPNILRSNYLK